MNAPIETNFLNAVPNTVASVPSRLREIPYNYTSVADREITIRSLGEEA